MREEYVDLIEDFPQRIDHLLDVINRVCLNVIMMYIHEYFSRFI